MSDIIKYLIFRDWFVLWFWIVFIILVIGWAVVYTLYESIKTKIKEMWKGK